MSKFLDELQELADAGFHEDIVKQINSLGENAKRMLEIGILQDELVKLGFNFTLHINPILMFKRDNIDIKVFNLFSCYVNKNNFVKSVYFFNCPTWQQDVLDKVKELINE